MQLFTPVWDAQLTIVHIYLQFPMLATDSKRSSLFKRTEIARRKLLCDRHRFNGASFQRPSLTGPVSLYSYPS